VEFERWQHHIAQLTHMRNLWNARYRSDLDIRPVVGLLKDGDRLYAYGYDAALIGGLLELPLSFRVVADESGEETAFPCFSAFTEMTDYITNELQKIGRSSFCMIFEEPSGKGEPKDEQPDQHRGRWGTRNK
jgi:hypothetical protein